MDKKIDVVTVSYLLGILSIVLSLFVPFAALPLGIIGLVQSNKHKIKKVRTLNLIGIGLSAIFSIISIISYVLVFEDISTYLI